jgi:CRP/FNR family transcriptional regulator, cyclic AMP receptor protein
VHSFAIARTSTWNCLTKERWRSNTNVIRYNLRIDEFKQRMGELLQEDAQQCRTIALAKNANAYAAGDDGEAVYFIESGQIKLVMLSAEGKECLLAVLTEGDVFGELCLSGLQERNESAVAMEKTVVRVIPSAHFCARLSRALLLEGFMQYLTVRIADQQAIIANLMTVDSEQRLGQTLLDLAHRLGKQDPRSIRIEQRITHEELAAMVGTTRPRVSEFMRRFRDLGLIEFSAERHVIVKETKLRNYLGGVQ